MANRTEQQSEKDIVEAENEIAGQAAEATQTAIGDSDLGKEEVRPAYYDYIEAGKALAESFKPREYQAEAQNEITGQASELAETATDDCDRVKEGVKPAYYDYIKAGKALAESFKPRERRAEAQDEIIGQTSESAQGVMDHRDGAREGVQFANCDGIEAGKALAEALKQREPAIEMAIKVREKAGQDALVSYTEELDKVVNKASQVYKEAIEIAIKVREEAEQDALVAYTEEVDKAVNKASQLYKEAIETAARVREKAEQDALVACTEEVDQAVDEASQLYKDKIKQAWIDCKQRIMHAWADSMETSIEITGVLQPDTDMDTSPTQPPMLDEDLVNQSG